MKNLTLFSILYILCVYTAIIAQKYTGEVIFPNMKLLLEYSKNLTEKPNPDSPDWSHVSYRNYFYSRKHPTTWADLKFNLSIRAMNLSISEAIEKSFKEQIKKTMQQRQKVGYKESFVSIIRPETGTRFIIIANLNGSFHSLIRFLVDWTHRGIIDDNFKIKEPYVLIFDGNTLSDSPYGLDTLALILKILEANTERVFFVRGNQEGKGYWQTTNLNFEIEERMATPKEARTLLGNFFDTLPLALYLFAETTTTSIDLVRISNYALTEHSFDEYMVADLFMDPTRKSIRLDEQSIKYANLNVNVRALIHGSSNPSKADKGLIQEGRKDNMIIWQAQSGSTGALQVSHRFFYESYLILDTATELSGWSLVLYSHDTRKQTPLEAQARYNLLTGAQMVDKDVQENKIRHYQEKRKNSQSNFLKQILRNRI
jgi:hypothetical protein